MSARLAALFAATALASCASPRFWSMDKAAPETQRQTKAGPVLGGLGRYDSHAWLGIPFAAPPVGPLRWRAPQPVTPWQAPRPALAPGNVCPQPGGTLGGGKPGEVVGDEDCLHLSVWAPRFTPEQVPTGAKRLPVMVWIHGGGNSIGTTAFYDGGRLATDQQVVVVALQYRLGPLGWLRHAALREGADELDASGNYGTLDLLAGLAWVRDNAAAFGGDPGNVTIFGESAGGLDVYTLLLSPRAKGLFHRAVVQSGGFWTTPLDRAEAFKSVEPQAHKNSSNEVLARLLVSEKRAADDAEARALLGHLPPAELAQWMRALPPAKWIGAYVGGGRAGMLDAPLVYPDGVVLPADDWLAQLQRGNWNKVPVLVGTNRDEMKLFLFLEPGRVTRVLGLFPKFEHEPSYLATAETFSRFWRVYGVERPVEAMLRSGGQVFTYRWDWRDEPTVLGGDLAKMLGAGHGLEVPFVFGHFDMGPLNVIFTKDNEAGREAISAAMRRYWATFARTGTPGTGGGQLPEWTPAALDAPGTADQPTQLLFDVEANGGLRMAPGHERLGTILSDLFADPRLDVAQKCHVLHDLVTWNRGVLRGDYDTRTECQPFPFDDFPWKKG